MVSLCSPSSSFMCFRAARPGVEHPELLTDVIRSSWSIPWNEIGNVKRLTKLLPYAFPPLASQLYTVLFAQSFSLFVGLVG